MARGMVEVEDMIDKAVVRTILNGGEVFFHTAEQLPKNADIAALFRY